MNPRLIRAAEQWCIDTHVSVSVVPAGADVSHERDVPRHELEVAHELLARVLSDRPRLIFGPLRTGQWWVHVGEWYFRGSFVEAVAELALHLDRRV